MPELETEERAYFRAVHQATQGDGVFPAGHPWAGFTQAESLEAVARKLTPEEAQAERQDKGASGAVKDTGPLSNQTASGADGESEAPKPTAGRQPKT